MSRFATTAERNRFRRIRAKVLKRDGYQCQYCRVSLTPDPGTKPRPDNAATVDHVTPLASGGQSEATNLVACCHSCNTRKGVCAPSFLSSRSTL